MIGELKKNDPFADPEHVVDNAAVDTDVREEVGHEDVVAKIEMLEDRVKDIDRALRKIRQDKYGVCEKCGKPISIERLKLVPEARYCLECKKKMQV